MEFIDKWKEEHKEARLSWLAEAIGLSRKMFGGKTTTIEKAVLSEEDTVLKDKILAILFEFPRYGYRKVTASLKRCGERINKKRVARVMKIARLSQKRRKWKPKTTDSRHKLQTYPNLVKEIIPSYPHHIWAADITYVRLLNEFCYVATIIDCFTKKIVGWNVDLRMETSLCMDALELALLGGVPEFHHSDRGGQYCSTEYTDTLKAHDVKISMADPGMSVDNPYAESFNKTLKVEEVYLKEYRTISDAEKSMKRFIEEVYNKKRLHSSIGYVPPEEFEREWFTKNGEEVLLEVHY